jgi:hypothetical protein
VPKKYFFRLHHVRPRFKNNIENVLIYIAQEISQIKSDDCESFRNKLNNAIKLFPGNINSSEKTINNWRTEISSLFGFYIEDKNVNITIAGQRALDLYNKQDLIQFFKIFLYFFQYPGGHIKSHEVLKCIENGINFKPVKFILSLLQVASKKSGKKIGITKAEATHIIFNDLRVTANLESTAKTAGRLLEAKDNSVEFDWTGDIIRYAGDILDYMEIANLLKSYNGTFYLNSLEGNTINFFVKSNEWFTNYDNMIAAKAGELSEINKIAVKWFRYVNKKVKEDFFATDILSVLSKSPDDYENIKSSYNDLLLKAEEQGLRTKEIGDLGESLAYGHECKRITLVGREDLIHLIQIIPTSFAVGYDIQSVETDERKRYIEVKTTISSKLLTFNKFHLTPNEWNTAKTLADRYFVYRLFINKESNKLFIIQDPNRLYKDDKIDMMINKDAGIEISFNTEHSGIFEELLTWKE